jgi:hypothetical protein
MKLFLALSSFFLLALAQPCLADELAQAQEFSRQVASDKQTEQRKLLKAIELFCGFASGKVHTQGNYQMVPLIADLDFDLKYFTEKIGFCPAIMLDFQLEPYFAAVTSPKGAIETGASFFLKFGFTPDTWTLQPYLKVGTGLSYMTLKTNEQADSFNYISSGCFGISYFFSPDTAFNIEGRYRHLSNNSRKSPNHGINTAFFLLGITRKF